MVKILFLIHDLGPGGAEKVLVNLVNNMDPTKFDITAMALFGGGVNEQFLKPHIKYKKIFKHSIPGNSKIMKCFSAEHLHQFCVREHYDIEVSYLEGPSARIISGCQDKRTKLVSWIHIEQHTKKKASESFRNYTEATKCYLKFDRTICVSASVKKDFESIFTLKRPAEVLYNTNESSHILEMAKDEVDVFSDDEFKVIGVGKILPNKGFDRLARIHCQLIDDGYRVHTYVLGDGRQREEITSFITKRHAENTFTFLGYQTNPYKYVANADLFVCASHAEGFSTAATEALIVGTPVCTVDVSGMKEMLGDDNEYGVVVKNEDDSLYKAIKCFIEDTSMYQKYKQKAAERGKFFNTRNTVEAVENMFFELIK